MGDDYLVKLLRNYSDRGGVLLNVLSDFEILHTAWTAFLQGVSRAGALANN